MQSSVSTHQQRVKRPVILTRLKDVASSDFQLTTDC